MSYQAATSYSCDAATPKRARGWTTEWLVGVLPAQRVTSETLDDAALVVSELVTNALQAGGSAVTVRLAVDGPRLRISVIDDAPGLPRVVHAGPDDQRGRGLPIVAEVSRVWGVTPLPAGKQVWAELVLPP